MVGVSSSLTAVWVERCGLCPHQCNWETSVGDNHEYKKDFVEVTLH